MDYNESQEPTKSEQIVLVDIDEPTLEKLGQYPIPRNILADYIDEAPEALIGLNVLLSEEDRFGGDAALASALSWKNSVLAITPSSKTNTKYRPPQIGTATFGEKDAKTSYQNLTECCLRERNFTTHH